MMSEHDELLARLKQIALSAFVDGYPNISKDIDDAAAAIRSSQAQLETERRAREEIVEDLGTCELCQRDLITPNPDGSHHNCVCIACLNAEHSDTLNAERRLAEVEQDARRYRKIKTDHEIPWQEEVPESIAGRFYVMFGGDPIGCLEGELDAAIDAAIKESAEQEKEK